MTHRRRRMGHSARWEDAARPLRARGGDRGKLGTGWNPSLPRGGTRPGITWIPLLRPGSLDFRQKKLLLLSYYLCHEPRYETTSIVFDHPRDSAEHRLAEHGGLGHGRHQL